MNCSGDEICVEDCLQWLSGQVHYSIFLRLVRRQVVVTLLITASALYLAR